MKSSDRFAAASVVCRLSGRELRVADLSVGGLFVETDEVAPPPGQFVEFELCLGQPHAPFRLVGRVVWRDEHGTHRTGHKGFGLQITRIDLRDKIALLDWLRHARPVSAATTVNETAGPRDALSVVAGTSHPPAHPGGHAAPGRRT